MESLWIGERETERDRERKRYVFVVTFNKRGAHTIIEIYIDFEVCLGQPRFVILFLTKKLFFASWEDCKLWMMSKYFALFTAFPVLHFWVIFSSYSKQIIWSFWEKNINTEQETSISLFSQAQFVLFLFRLCPFGRTFYGVSWLYFLLVPKV